MFFEELTDDEWTRLAPLAADEPVHPHRRGRPRAEPRVVANAVLWILTTGERWSKLPARYPSGPTCRRRFDDWLADGTLTEIVKVLSEFGRTFAYVPQPETLAQPAPKAAPVPAPESPRLRGVFWTNPESWQSTNDCAPIDGATEPLSTMNPPVCMHIVRGEVPVASSRRAPTPGVPMRANGDYSHEMQPVDSMTVMKHCEDYLDHTIQASAQPVAKQLQLSYRASAEIVKDGRRIERSGLIGPRFADSESAVRFALHWARDWIDRHEAAARPRPEVVEEAMADQAVDAQSAAETATAAVAASSSAQSAPRAIESGVIRSRTPDWLLHAPDSRGDSKPPEVLYHA